MNKKNIIKDKMKYKYVEEIVKWKYDKEYSIYNMPPMSVMKEKNYNILKEEMADNYICYLLNNEVIAYVNMKEMEDKRIFIGIGLKPEYCGKGYGNYFLEDSLNEIKKKYPGRIIYLEVRSWNERAIKAYKRIGFKVTGVETKKDHFENDSEFVTMEYL